MCRQGSALAVPRCLGREFVMQCFSRRWVVRSLGLTAVAQPFIRPSGAAAMDLPLAIKGYDPVAYFTTGGPARGLPEFELVWDEHCYRFASAEHRELFKDDPVRYAPQFANFCAMALARGEVIEANPEYWLVSGGKLYIFARPTGPAMFERELTGNVAKADGNRALIAR
jgi:hypothetical protein